MATAIEKQACLPQFSVLLLNNFLAFANILPVRRSCKLGNFTGPPIFYTTAKILRSYNVMSVS